MDRFVYLSTHTDVIIKNLNKLNNWNYLLANDFAIEIIENNLDQFTEWDLFSFNNNIFTYDYKKIKELNSHIIEGLVMYFLHPNKIQKFLEMNDTVEDYDYFK